APVAGGRIANPCSSPLQSVLLKSTRQSLPCSSGTLPNGPLAGGGVMAHLLIRRGANPGQRIPLTQDTVVLGRSPDCDIPIPSPSTSRQHARLMHLHEKWYIEDMLSRNGTYVNNQLIQARTQLQKNDRIRICDFEVIFSDAPILL